MGSQDPFSGCFAASWPKSQVIQGLASKGVLYMNCNSQGVRELCQHLLFGDDSCHAQGLGVT